uniref:Mut7-C RNAse domain-containing protein n=1 Tax=candidate division WOR-3 bacterium TaxID=2052148 RepID=A0A7C4Y4N6_UNCW3
MKFLCDFMLGRLAKWMRLLGYDTEFFKEPDYNKLIVFSNATNRIIITRNSKLKDMKNVIYIKEERIEEQLRKILTLFPETNPLTRCSLCNTEIIEIKKEDVLGKVPEYVYKNQKNFYLCPKCNKIYWEGTHIELMREFLRRVG